MLTKLRLKQFKNFQDAELTLGNFTLIVGTNASGKSNIRDAFRFLHGISRGYNLAEIIGEKWVESGVLQWRGIRGGIKEIAFNDSEYFTLELDFNLEKNEEPEELRYSITVDPGANMLTGYNIKSDLTMIKSESIKNLETNNIYFEANFYSQKITVPEYASREDDFLSKLKLYLIAVNYPLLPRLLKLAIREPGEKLQEVTQAAISNFSSMRFLDLSPDAMRQPSIPGQTILGDRGENLSSVLYAICSDNKRKQILLQWIQELTPMDAVDFEFPSDFTGRILLTLVEKNGQRISAISASDGTLRFLAIIAALLGPEPAKFYFFEEIDNGIHPARLHLLLQLIETQVAKSKIQIVATTHSPQLLRLLSPQSLEYAALTYRLPNRPDAKIQRILDIPEAKRVIETQDLARLHESGWLEDAVEFMADEDEEMTE